MNYKNYTLYVPLVLLSLLMASCSKQKTKAEMTAQELEKKALTLIAKGNREDAIDYLKVIVSRHHNDKNISKHKLLLAEMYFKNGHFEAARAMYEHFHQLYPSDERAEYAKYQSIRAQFNQTLRLDCDQEPTLETIKLCKNYLSSPIDTIYKEDVQDIKKTCEYKLIDKEIYVFDFYLKREEYAAAESRLAYLQKNFLPEHEELTSRLLFLECKLAHRTNDKKRKESALNTLATEYPESQYTHMAHSLATKKTTSLFDLL